MEIKLNDIKQWLRKYRFLEIEVGILLIAYLFRILPNAGAEGVAIWAAFVFPLYYFVYFVMQKCGTIKLIKQMNERQLIFQFLVIILAGLMVVSLLSKNRTFYFWDFGGYWGASIDEAKLILHDPQACLRDLYNSINKEVYNRIIPFIISIPLNILGVDFHIYELVVFGMFVVPTYLAFLSMFDEQFALHNVGIICFTFFSCVVIYTPLLLGYLDAFSLFMFSLAMLVLSKNYLEKFDFTKSILLTIALLLSAFGRRYFAYAVIAIAISVAIVAVMKLARTDKMHRKTFFLELLKSVSTICCLIIFVAIIFWKFIQNSISGTLAVVYSAYQQSDCLGNYWLLVKNYGVITCIIAVIGIIFMLKNKKNTQFLLELVLSFLICTYLFFRVQSMGNHHYYLTVIPILFFVAYCLGYCSIKKIRFLLGGMVTLLVFNMMVALVDIPLLLRVENLWTVQRMEPQIRSDIDQLQSMRRDLERWSDDGHVIYIIASSTIINDDLIRKMNMPDELISVENLCVSSHVDLRDGFPLMFLNSDVVVVTNPIQYHLNEEGQRVIGILAEEVTSGNLSKYFIKLTSYELDNGVVANVYARNSMFTDEDYYELIEQFDKYYFDYPELFRDRIEAYAGF